MKNNQSLPQSRIHTITVSSHQRRGLKGRACVYAQLIMLGASRAAAVVHEGKLSPSTRHLRERGKERETETERKR